MIKLIVRIVWMGLLPLVGAMTLAYFIWEWLFFSVFFGPNYSFDRRVEQLGAATSDDGAFSLAVVNETSSFLREGREPFDMGLETRVTLTANGEDYSVAYIYSGGENPLGQIGADDRLSLEWVARDRAQVRYCGVRLSSASNVVTIRSDPWRPESDVVSHIEIEFVRVPDCEITPPSGLNFPGLEGSVSYRGRTGAVSRQ